MTVPNLIWGEICEKSSAREVTTPTALARSVCFCIEQNGGGRPEKSTLGSDLGALAIEAVRVEVEFLHVG